MAKVTTKIIHLCNSESAFLAKAAKRNLAGGRWNTTVENNPIHADRAAIGTEGLSSAFGAWLFGNIFLVLSLPNQFSQRK